MPVIIDFVYTDGGPDAFMVVLTNDANFDDPDLGRHGP